MALATVGSDTWQDASQVITASPRGKLIANCIKTVKWESLLMLCSNLREGTGCKISEKFSVGSHNLVKLVDFDDGVKWVARISLQVIDDFMTASVEERMDREVTIYKFLKLHSHIPVPEVYAFDTSTNGEIGAPFMLLTYLHGTVPDELDLNEDQKQFIQSQVAETMIKLAAMKFDRIGHITMDEEGEFRVGKDLETNDGPYSTAGEYYNALSKSRFRRYADIYLADNLEAEKETGIFVPFVFNSLIQMMTNCNSDTGPFSLVHTDMGFHNILVDADLKIIGIIDCGEIYTAPIHVVAQVPSVNVATAPSPGFATRNPLWKATHEEGRPGYENFLKIFEEAEKRITGKTELAEAMVSNGVQLVKGLDKYLQLQDVFNSVSIRSYMYMYFHTFHGPKNAKEFTEAHIPQDDSDYDDGSDQYNESESSEQVEKQGNEENSTPKEVGNEQDLSEPPTESDEQQADINKDSGKDVEKALELNAQRKRNEDVPKQPPKAQDSSLAKVCQFLTNPYFLSGVLLHGALVAIELILRRRT